MDSFWEGFEKRAASLNANQIDKWIEASGEVKKKPERNDTDPVELSSSFTPDTYRRG
jgi:hypothetical protein